MAEEQQQQQQRSLSPSVSASASLPPDSSRADFTPTSAPALSSRLPPLPRYAREQLEALAQSGHYDPGDDNHDFLHPGKYGRAVSTGLTYEILERHELMNNIVWRNGPKDMRRPAALRGVVGTIVGTPVSVDRVCRNCQRGRGPFRGCYAVEGELNGGCTNCYWFHRGGCTLRGDNDEDDKEKMKKKKSKKGKKDGQEGAEGPYRFEGPPGNKDGKGGNNGGGGGPISMQRAVLVSGQIE